MYYTTNEVAQLLGFTIETVRRKIRKGEIFAFKVRDKIRVPQDEVKRYLENMLQIENASIEEKEIIVNNILNANKAI